MNRQRFWMLQSQFKRIIHTNSFAWTNAFSACEVFHIERYFFCRFQILCKMSIICGCRYYCRVMNVVTLQTCTQKMLSVKFARMKFEVKFTKNIANEITSKCTYKCIAGERQKNRILFLIIYGWHVLLHLIESRQNLIEFII